MNGTGQGRREQSIMSQDASFADVMARLRQGDQDAAREIFVRYTHRLIGLARSRLDRLVRQKVDPEDVLQSVYKSFFLRHTQGEFAFDGWDGLWALLTVITLRKCGRRVEYYHASRRDVQREVAPPTDPDDSAAGWLAADSEPTPSEAALLAETVEQIMSRLDERERSILALTLQGYSTPDISARVGRTERTVQRVLKRVRDDLEALQAADAL